MSDRSTRLAGLYATISGGVVVTLSPLLALSYFATKDGASELDTSTVSAWAKPAREIAGGLLTFASPERVYGTYLQGFALIFPAVLLCAWVTRSQRPRPKAGLERWGWRVALLGYTLLTAGLAVAFCMEVTAISFGTSTNGPLNVLFLSILVPGLLLATTGSSVLGIGLMRTDYRPRVTAWLLALGFPLFIVGSVVLGHNSLGLIPLFLAWAATGARLWRSNPLYADEGSHRAGPEPRSQRGLGRTADATPVHKAGTAASIADDR